MIRRRCSCETKTENTRNMTRTLNDTMSRSALAIATSSEKLYMNIHYHVIYRNSGENLPLAVLQSQHQMLNASLNKINTNIAKVPSSGRYNFKDSIGNVAVVVIPSNYTELTEQSVTRIPSNREFTGLADVLNWMSTNGHNMKAESVNLIICPMPSILGEAEVVGFRMCVTTGSVGGEVTEGSIDQYRLGVTAVHEMGHLLGLPHVFDGDCNQTFTDVPSQLYPNYDFELFKNENNEWDGKLCNRYRDCKFYRNGDTNVLISGQPQPYSCFTCSETTPECTQCDTVNYEQGCNFMDYGTDDHLVMFTQQQSLFMRQVALSGNTGITLVDSDGGEIIAINGENIEGENTTAPAVGNSGIGTWGIVGIVCGIVAIFVIIATILVIMKKKNL